MLLSPSATIGTQSFLGTQALFAGSIDSLSMSLRAVGDELDKSINTETTEYFHTHLINYQDATQCIQSSAKKLSEIAAKLYPDPIIETGMTDDLRELIISLKENIKSFKGLAQKINEIATILYVAQSKTPLLLDKAKELASLISGVLMVIDPFSSANLEQRSISSLEELLKGNDEVSPSQRDEISSSQRTADILRLAELSYDSMVDGVMVVNMRGKIIYVNHAFLELLDCTREDLLKEDAEKHLPESEREKFVDVMKKLQAGQDRLSDELRIERRDGTQSIVNINFSLLQEAGADPIGIVAVYRDVTELKKAAEIKRQLSLAKTAAAAADFYSSVVRHEISAPLLSAIAFLEPMIQDLRGSDAWNEETQEDWEVVQAIFAQIGRIARSMDQKRKKTTKVDLLDINEELEVNVAAVREARETINFNPVLSPWLVLLSDGDAAAIIRNIVNNAQDTMEGSDTQELYIETSKVTITHARQTNVGLIVNETIDNLFRKYGLKRTDCRPGAYMRIRFKDTGHGMDEETKARIFEKGFSTKTTGDPEKDEHAGYGLTIVQQIVRDAGGFITADSEPGKGSTFDVYLPRAEEKEG